MSEYRAPFPYFGGKSTIAPVVWQRLGADVHNYIEPFAGSAAMLLARPGWTSDAPLTETINDADGFVANFWRALQHDPEAVAHYADWPVNENDLHARHAWLVHNHLGSLAPRLEGDPDWYDAKVAGWWVWGMSVWIGSGFCSGRGPWRQIENENGDLVLAKGDDGRGVQRLRVHLGNDGMGVGRQLVHLGDDGRGVGEAGTGEQGLYAWMQALADRLRRVRVACGDWSRICGPTPTVSRWPVVGVFLDPPYSVEAGRYVDIYSTEDMTVAHEVRRWAIEHGDDPRYRIALCGYDTEHGEHMPDGWTAHQWSTKGGMSSTGNGAGKVNRHREVVWFSPHCLRTEAIPQQATFQF